MLARARREADPREAVRAQPEVGRVELRDERRDRLAVDVRVQHAGDDVVEEHVHINDFTARLAQRMDLFGGGVVDMPYLPRINEGIIRCYMFRGRCGGVLHQTNVELIESCQNPKLHKLNLTRG